MPSRCRCASGRKALGQKVEGSGRRERDVLFYFRRDKSSGREPAPVRQGAQGRFRQIFAVGRVHEDEVKAFGRLAFEKAQHILLGQPGPPFQAQGRHVFLETAHGRGRVFHQQGIGRAPAQGLEGQTAAAREQVQHAGLAPDQTARGQHGEEGLAGAAHGRAVALAFHCFQHAAAQAAGNDPHTAPTCAKAGGSWRNPSWPGPPAIRSVPPRGGVPHRPACP